MNCLNSLQEPQVSESLSQNFSIWRPPCPCCHLWKEPNLLPQGVSSSRRSWYPPLCHVHVPSAALFDPQSCNLRTTSNVRGCPLSIMFSSSKLFENHLWIPAPWPRSLFNTKGLLCGAAIGYNVQLWCLKALGGADLQQYMWQLPLSQAAGGSWHRSFCFRNAAGFLLLENARDIKR